MLRIMARGICVGGVLVLTGCSDASKVPVQPVSIIGSDFCDTMGEKLTWDVKDTRPTIKGINRLNAKWDAKGCGKDAAKPTS